MSSRLELSTVIPPVNQSPFAEPQLSTRNPYVLAAKSINPKIYLKATVGSPNFSVIAYSIEAPKLIDESSVIEAYPVGYVNEPRIYMPTEDEIRKIMGSTSGSTIPIITTVSYDANGQLKPELRLYFKEESGAIKFNSYSDFSLIWDKVRDLTERRLQPKAPIKSAQQFLSNLYSQVLGRAPDNEGWNFWESEVIRDNSANQLRRIGSVFLTSPEFLNKSYTSEQRLSTLYRFALNREADRGGVDYWKNQIDLGIRSFSQVVIDFFWSNEFNSCVSKFTKTNYDFGSPSGIVFEQTVSSPGFSGTGEQLQEVINRSAEGTTIYLAQGAAIPLNKMLVLDNKVTIATWDLPSSSEYQKQARLYRSSSFTDGALIGVASNSHINSVWIDGQRNKADNPTLNKAQNINVGFWGGEKSSIKNSRVDNSGGFSNITVAGLANGVPEAKDILISTNFIDSTYSNHQKNWTDGISFSGEKVNVINNVVLNSTDVGIVAFAMPGSKQHSYIAGNLVINLSNSAYGGLVSDGVYDSGGLLPFTTTADATELLFINNILWNSKATHFDIGISAGTRPWFGTESFSIKGSSFYMNHSNGQALRVGTGIVVSGALPAKVSYNFLDLVFAEEAIKALPRVTLAIARPFYGGIEGYIDPTAGDFFPIDLKPERFIYPDV